MINYEKALKKVLEKSHVLKKDEKLLLKSMGQVAAEDVYSAMDLPQSAISGPDGYAVRSDDIKNTSLQNPAVLRITATARAGYPSRGILKKGTAIRIMTGSVIPYGADCVVRFEDTDEPGEKNGPNTNNPSLVKIYISAKPGDNIRLAGSNVKKGAFIIPEGTPIGPTQISALAAIGQNTGYGFPQACSGHNSRRR